MTSHAMEGRKSRCVMSPHDEERGAPELLRSAGSETSCRRVAAGSIVPMVVRSLRGGSYWLSLCRVLVLLCLSAWATAAYSQSSSWNRREEFSQAGYTELSGADAVRFLVGNSVLVERSDDADREKNILVEPAIRHFQSDHVLMECRNRGSLCDSGPWSVQGNKICSDLGACEPVRVLKSPQSDDWEGNNGRLGVYLVADHFAYDIVKGNWTSAPVFDPHATGHLIELRRIDLAQAYQDGSIPISGQRAMSLLIGNTFLPKGALDDRNSNGIEMCPSGGTYYSPDGKVVEFSCQRLGTGGHSWSLRMSHWKIISGLFCRNDADDDAGDFGCTRARVTAIPDPASSRPDGAMRVLDYAGSGLIDSAFIGYSGNVFSFQSVDVLKADHSEEK